MVPSTLLQEIVKKMRPESCLIVLPTMNLRLWILLFALILHIKPTFQNVLKQDSKFSPALERDELLKDVSFLPSEGLMTGFLTKDMPARYYFLVNKDHTPVTIRVTPCESPLHWRLTFLKIPQTIERDNTLHQDSQRYPHRKAHVQLFSYKGNGEEAYFTANSSAGLYKLELLSEETDTSFQVFTSTSQEPNTFFPGLPLDPRVDVISIEQDRVTLAWKPSPGSFKLGSKFEYCVFVNRLHNFKTLCATEPSLQERHRKGSLHRKDHWDTEVTKLEKFSKKHTAGILNEIQSIMKNLQELKRDASMVDKTFKGLQAPNVLKPDIVDGQRVCVGNRTNVTLSGLQPGTHYYFDVFARNHEKKTSSAYTGVFAETKDREKTRFSKLEAEEMTHILLMSKEIRFLKLQPASSNGWTWLFIHSCVHKTNLKIIVKGKIVVSQSIVGAQIFQLPEKADKYILRLSASNRGPSLVKLFATNTPYSLPFLSLPADPHLTVSSDVSTCSSVTMSWLGTQESNKYCIYMRNIEENLDLRLIRKHQNSCLSPNARLEAERIVCKCFQGTSPWKTVVQENIEGLKPGKLYLIDVYMFGQNNYVFKYPSQVVKTWDLC
ncbi:protein NDNF isoform X1 [Microcaecilia unicolor]|uniref:Protein NDNF n=1 Tax=Microcaecilia unicolor TaxID=1415580 RepID=A0A6P7YWT5_9AMPH|nr:protein NDNF-like isoform X1 [Microcaecilia unicolor]XP_030069040.1 protein NDNF-like isoform X1 [Microcaecilia unicolor]XP_030069041.1 protein NDNF-like isoform X1 [Microcaecilia unicolor]